MKNFEQFTLGVTFYMAIDLGRQSDFDSSITHGVKNFVKRPLKLKGFIG